MSVKKILLSFSLLLLCKVSFALVFIPRVSAKYNVSKTHYLVSVPDMKSSLSGYTAVFETKSNKFLYKLDLFFANGLVFLSDDGSQLMYLESEFESKSGATVETCSLHFYDGKKVTSTVEIYKEKDIAGTDGYTNTSYDADQELNALSIISEDFIYDVNINDQKVSNRENTEPRTLMNIKLSEDFMDTDSLMSIQNILLANNQSLKEKLLQDFDLKEVPDQSTAQKVIYYLLYISKDNNLSKIQFNTFDLPKKGSYSEEFLEKLSDKINEKVKSYSYTEHIIPEGVDYWIYEGEMYVTD